MTISFNNVGVVGVGAMGLGIAQMAAQAGAQVHLFDAQAPAVEKAIRAITQQWQKMLEKGSHFQRHLRSLHRPFACLRQLGPVIGVRFGH